jgi:hypothetical protein
MGKNTLTYLAVIVIFVLIVAYFIQRSNKNKAIANSTDEAYQNIEQGNQSGNVSSAGGGNTQPDTNYNASADAKTIYNAGCWKAYYCVTGANEDTITAVFNRLNRSQVLKLDQTFQASYGMTLDKFFLDYAFQSENQIIYAAVNKALARK